MYGLAGAIVVAMIGLGDETPPIEAEHARNTVFRAVMETGLESGGTTVKLPAPRIQDGLTPDQERVALKAVAGSERRLEEMLRRSVTAPYIIKVRDEKAADDTIRIMDLWFVVHADISKVDPAKEASKTDQTDVEAGNMAVRTRLLPAEEVRAAGHPPTSPGSGAALETWYAHIQGRLLDRIAVDVTNEVIATRTGNSIVVASRTDPAFDRAGKHANGWRKVAAVEKNPATDVAVEPYRGGISYAKISRLSFQPGALLVEMHGAFVEPHGWFQGAPILRSKFSVVAQDQIRRLRRELEQKAAS